MNIFVQLDNNSVTKLTAVFLRSERGELSAKSRWKLLAVKITKTRYDISDKRVTITDTEAGKQINNKIYVFFQKKLGKK